MSSVSSSVFDRAARKLQRSPSRPANHPAHCEPRIQLADVGLRFRIYTDKTLSLKQAFVGWLRNRVRSAGPAAQTPPAPTEFWALRNINLTLTPGMRIGLIGHNGAGKTTLLRVMSRIYTPSVGKLAISGSVAPLLELGGGFNPELSARENVLFYGALFGFHRRVMLQRAAAVLDFAGVTPFADMPVKYFSSGMIARLAFSAATDIDPEILLVDEIFAIGDTEFRDKARRRMKDLMQTAKIVVLATHELALVSELCNHVIWMRAGEMAAQGPPDHVLPLFRAAAHQPAANPQTASSSRP